MKRVNGAELAAMDFANLTPLQRARLIHMIDLFLQTCARQRDRDARRSL